MGHPPATDTTVRIRTIKPEFWGHPVISRQTAVTRLLAIALLNYADDEGYFYADPDLVRGALFPREDSTIIRRSLDDLSRIGYIDVRESVSHGAIGHIVQFSRHQRVDRAKPSFLKELHSSIDRRGVDEASTNDRRWKGREGKGKEGSGGTYDEDSFKAPPVETPPRRNGEAPTLDDAVAWGRGQSFRGSVIRSWWNNREAQGWQRGNGMPIANWQADLTVWAHNEDRLKTPQHRAGGANGSGKGSGQGTVLPAPQMPKWEGLEKPEDPVDPDEARRILANLRSKLTGGGDA